MGFEANFVRFSAV